MSTKQKKTIIKRARGVSTVAHKPGSYWVCKFCSYENGHSTRECSRCLRTGKITQVCDKPSTAKRRTENPGCINRDMAEEPKIVYVCGNCDHKTKDEWDLLPIQDIGQRVLPGEPMPAGECPKCHALVHAEDREPSAEQLFAELLAYKRQAFENDEDVNGADMVDWFSEFRLRVKTAIK